MKTRTTFVSNSSSSSFLLRINNEDVKKGEIINPDQTVFVDGDEKYSRSAINAILAKIIKSKKPASKKEILDYFQTQLYMNTRGEFRLLNGDPSFIQMLTEYGRNEGTMEKYYLLVKYCSEFLYLEKKTARIPNLHFITKSDFININSSPIPKLIDELCELMYKNLMDMNYDANKKEFFMSNYLLDIGCGGGSDMDSDMGGIIRFQYEELFSYSNYLQINNS